MPAPSFSLVSGLYGDYHRSVKFGGQPVPVGKNFTGNLAYVDINDGVNWFMQNLRIPDSHELVLAQQVWRGQAAYVSEDYGPITLQLPFYFEEVGGVTLRSQIAKLFTAGEQYLTFDGGQTGFLARIKSFGSPTPRRNMIDPIGWDGEFSFLCREPLYRDVAQTTSQIFAAIVTGAQSGTITYPGGFRTRPIWSLSTGGGSTAVITQVQIQNTDSGQSATVAGLSIGAGAHTLQIDCDAMKVTIDGGGDYDLTGDFPDLFPDPAISGGVNHITLTVTISSGVLAGTFSALFNSRW